MAEQVRSDIYAVFTMVLWALNYKNSQITLLSELKWLSYQRLILGDTIWSWLVNISLITYKTLKLKPQKIMVKAIWQNRGINVRLLLVRHLWGDRLLNYLFPYLKHRSHDAGMI